MHYLKIITDRNGLIKQYAEQVEKLPAKFEFSANLISHKLFNIIQFVKTGADEKDYSLDIKVMLARYLNVINILHGWETKMPFLRFDPAVWRELG